MKSDKSRFIEAMTKLIKLTQENELNWQITKPSKTLMESTSANERINAVFLTSYKNEKLRLYEKEESLPETLVSGTNIGSYVPRFYNLKKTILEIIDDGGHILWTFPESRALDDLLSVVKYQAFKVNDFLSTILED